MSIRNTVLTAFILGATALLGGCVYEPAYPAYPSYAAAYPYPNYYGGYGGYYGYGPYGYGPTVGLGFGFDDGWHGHRGWH